MESVINNFIIQANYLANYSQRAEIATRRLVADSERKNSKPSLVVNTLN